MGSTYDDTVFDFDLNFLSPTTTNTVQELQAKNEKLRRSVIFLKKKILFSHSAVTRYKNARNYASMLKNNQVVSKEGCKQHLIEIKNFIEKVTKLENENRAAENREREKNETIADLQNKICALQSLETQLKMLLKEKNKIESTVRVEKKNCVKDQGKKGLLEKENEVLRKENAKIPKLEREIENLRKEKTGIATLAKESDSLFKDRTKILNLEKKIETLQLENAKISSLQKEIETLYRQNAKISKLEKELETLRKEKTKMSRLGKENESLRRENAQVQNLTKEVATLRIKIAKIGYLERVNKTLCEENERIRNTSKESLLTNLSLSIEEKEKSQAKKNQTRKTRSLSNRNSDWSDHSDAENDIFEDALLSPPPNESNVGKNFSSTDKTTVNREFEYDNSNEVVSIDTGRGSSLAYSDNEKGFPSPDYFSNDSPLNEESIENKGKTDSIPQSIIQIIVQEENDDICDSEETSTRTEPSNLIIMDETTLNQTNECREKSIGYENSNNMTPKKHTQAVLEKEFLDLHNSMQHESHIDTELENIFSTMKLNYHAVSPIPRTPVRVHDNVSTSESSDRSEKIMRCMYLSNKSDQLLIKLKGYLHSCTAEYFCKFNPNLTHQNAKFLQRKPKGAKDISSIHNIDKLITCFETILRAKQILTEDCTNSYLDDNIPHVDDNILIRNVTHPELTEDTFLEKQVENRSIRQTISPPICSPLPVLPDVQQKQLHQKDNTIVSANALSAQNNEDVLQVNQVKPGLSSINLIMSPGPIINHNDSLQDDRTENTISSVTPVSPELVQNRKDIVRSNQRRTRLFSNNSSTSPEPLQNCQDVLQDKQKVRLSSVTLPVSPEPMQHHNDVLQDNERLSSITSPMSPDSVQNHRKTRLSSITLTKSPEPIQNHKDDLQDNRRRTRLSLSFSSMSPEPIQNTKEGLQDNQRRTRLSSITSPMSPDTYQNLNHSGSVESTPDIKLPKNLRNVRGSQDSVEMNDLPIKDSTAKKGKIKKKTKLDKLRKNLAPKYKIRKETTPVKSLIKPKLVSPIKKHVIASDTSASLNDKDVYEKAVKIMAEINSQKSSKIIKSPTNKCTKDPLSPKPKNNLQNEIDNSNDDRISENSLITTRSKRKHFEVTNQCSVVLTKDPLLFTHETKTSPIQKTTDDDETSDDPTSRKRRRHSSNDSIVKCKRVLRSSTVQMRSSTEDNIEITDSNDENTRKSTEAPIAEEIKTTSTTCTPKLLLPNTQIEVNSKKSEEHHQLNSYSDLELFSEDVPIEEALVPVKEKDSDASSPCHPKESILCCMIEKYGVATVGPFAKKIPDSTVKLITEKIEQEIATISELPLNDTKNAMNSFVADLRKLNYKHFIAGLMKYLTKPERKQELFGKVSSSFAPAMTKAEQILLYVITHLKTYWPSVDIVDAVLSNIEYALFKLNRTPEFSVIESTSHFYALLCRYFGAKSRLRLFILDAMYCIQFKSVPLIKQCLEVWMHIIPLAHMGIAKSPLVTCLVYLLHFYKCEDKFNRVQEIRNILSRRYFYQITDWNETRILEMFRNSIKDLRDISIEKKMLRLALIILAKRLGPRWCQNNIIKNLLQPMIENENVPNSVKVFCVSMIGPLMKPYPVDMKVHCEIAINQLIDILNNDPTPQMEEAAIMSMMFINRHNQYSMNQTLLTRKMKPMSPELEKTICDYVKTKPIKIWKKTLSKIAR